MPKRAWTTIAVLGLALLMLGALPPLQAPVDPSPRVTGRIVAREVAQSAPGDHGRVAMIAGTRLTSGETAEPTLSATSDVIDAGRWFDHLGVRWATAPGVAEATVRVDVRWSAGGTSWSEWAALDEDHDMEEEGSSEHYALPLQLGPQRFAQYRVWTTAGDLDAARRVALTFMDVSDRNASPLERLANDVVGALRDLSRSATAAAAFPSVRVRTRADWAADESLMQWAPVYVPWKKAVVHHTVTTNGYTDAAAEIRSIYYFHAVTRGWGDIGYQFIVDKWGTIWTGRQGGDDVVGGHAFGWNEGSFAVATLGDFSTSTPPSATVDSAARLIAMKFAQRGIQPQGADPFTHKEEDANDVKIPVTSSPPNVLAHRDLSYKVGIYGAQTACPGDRLYGQVEAIRSLAQTYVNGKFSNLASLATQLDHAQNVGASVAVPVTVRNAGATTIPAATTRLSYQIVSVATNTVAVAQGPAVPLAGDLVPGAAQQVLATLNVPTQAGRYLVRWDLLQSGQWFTAAYGGTPHDEWLAAVEWDVTWISDNVPTFVPAAQTFPVTVTMRNTGARTWPAANVKLSYHWVSDVTQRTVVWNGDRATLPNDVAPGQQVSVTINVQAPSYPTRYRIQLDLVWEGAFWFGDKGVEVLDKIVNTSFSYGARYSGPASLTMAPSQYMTVPVTVTNTGNSAWPGGNSVGLGAHWYTSSGALYYWDGARATLPRDVAPGQSITLDAKVGAPRPLGSYRVAFDMVLEGVSWFSAKGTTPFSAPVAVRAPAFGASYAPGPIGGVGGATLPVRTLVPMTLTNTSNFTWSSPVFALAYHIYDGAGRVVTWDGTRTLLDGIVQPGQTTSVQAVLDLPSTPGTYVVRWDMVDEGVAWFSSKGVPTQPQSITIGSGSFGASYDLSAVPPSVGARTQTFVPVTVTNSSNFSFSPDSKTYLAYHWYGAGGTTVVWDGDRTALDIAPGQSATVQASVIAPAAPGSYTLAFDLVQEGVAWFSSRGVAAASRGVSVITPVYGATYEAPASASGAAGSTISVPVTVTNAGTRTWQPGAVFLAYHLYRNGQSVVWDGTRTALAASVAPGASASLQARIQLPATPGTYDVRLDLVEEGITWFSGRGVIPAALALAAQ